MREVEQRVEKLKESSESLANLPDAPIGAPDDFGELLDVQFELFALAWETNRTNVVTMKMVEEASMRVYANLGVHDAFHPTSHWGGFPERIANLRKIQNYHTSLFAKFAQRLANTPDGDGSLLDHSIILFGSNMGNSDAHDADLLPEALIGRGGGLKGNQHLHYERNTPLANLLVTMLDRAGVPAERAREVRRQHRAVLGSLKRPRSEHERQNVANGGRHRVAGGVAWLAIGAGRRSTHDDVNQRKPDGSTPLQWAVYEDDAAEVRRLIDAGADVSLANDYGATPMSLAAEVANTEILKLLLDAGADADSPNAEGMTALMAVARTGNVEAAKLLLEHGATVDAREGFGGQTALMWASARRHPADDRLAGLAWRRRRCALRPFATISATSRPKAGRRASTAAASRRCSTPRARTASRASTCCSRRAPTSILPDPDGVSPLHVAIMNANWDLAKQLDRSRRRRRSMGHLRRGAAVHRGRVALANRRRARVDRSAERDRRAWTIVRLLLERGANPNMQLFFRPANVRGATNTRGSTPLIRAANNNDLEVVKLLLEHGADATVYMADRQTPIHAVLAGRAREKDALELIRVLHEAGTDVNVVALVVHIEEVRGGSALHYAVRKRYKDVIRLLASYGIDMNLKDQDGLTALDYTQSRGFMPFMALQTPLYDEEAALLRELGATVMMAEGPRSGRCSARRRACGRTSGPSASRSCTRRSTRTRDPARLAILLSRRRFLARGRRRARRRAASGARCAFAASGCSRSRRPISAAACSCSRARAATCSRCAATTAR